MLTNYPMVLFPHTFITAERLKMLFEHFRQLEACNPEKFKKIDFMSKKKIVIFLPWYIENPLAGPEIVHATQIDIIRPSIHLKPDADFKKLLMEYEQWIRQNPDRGYTGFIGKSDNVELQEESGWEIRRMVQKRDEENLNTCMANTKALKWHLILHLAKEYEDNQEEAKNILDRIKKQESPLHQAVDESPLMNRLFEDLPDTGQDFFIDEYRLRQIFEAWLGLFGELLPHKAIFITFHRHCLNYMMNIFEDAGIKIKTEIMEISSENEGSDKEHIIITYFPTFSKLKDNKDISFLKPFSNKIVLYINL